MVFVSAGAERREGSTPVGRGRPRALPDSMKKKDDGLWARTSQPRIHDLRHSFVVRRLLRWHEEGADVDRKILALTTYLGHARVADTYWYCTAVPELLASAGQRFERFVHRASERPS